MGLGDDNCNRIVEEYLGSIDEVEEGKSLSISPPSALRASSPQGGEGLGEGGEDFPRSRTLTKSRQGQDFVNSEMTDGGEDGLRLPEITDNKNFYAKARNSNFRDDSVGEESQDLKKPHLPFGHLPLKKGEDLAGANSGKKSRKLTGKEEKFCYLVAIELRNQSEAYRMAYDCKTENKDTINNLAYKLCRKDEIRARINELRKEADESVYWSINDAVKTIDYLIVEALNKKSKVERIREVEDGVDLFGNPIYKRVKTIEEVDKKQLGIVAKLLDMRFKLTGKYRDEPNNVIMTGEINFNLNAIRGGGGLLEDIVKEED